MESSGSGRSQLTLDTERPDDLEPVVVDIGACGRRDVRTERMANSSAVGARSPVESPMPVRASIDARRPSRASAGGFLTGAVVMVAGYSGLPLTLAIDRGVHSLPAATLAATSVLSSSGLLILLILRRTSQTMRGRPPQLTGGAVFRAPEAA